MLRAVIYAVAAVVITGMVCRAAIEIAEILSNSTINVSVRLKE